MQGHIQFQGCYYYIYIVLSQMPIVDRDPYIFQIIGKTPQIAAFETSICVHLQKQSLEITFIRHVYHPLVYLKLPSTTFMYVIIKLPDFSVGAFDD